MRAHAALKQQNHGGKKVGNGSTPEPRRTI
jgi:hypothetical protein